jgi:hypothetical protein
MSLHSNRSINKSINPIPSTVPIDHETITSQSLFIQQADHSSPNNPSLIANQPSPSSSPSTNLSQLNRNTNPTHLTNQALSFGKFVYSSNSTIFSPSSEPGVAARAEEFPFLEDDLRKADRVRTKRARWRRRRGRGA